MPSAFVPYLDMINSVWPLGPSGVFCAMRRPSVIAHRGASGYEYENSRAAFRRAVMLDADGVELDIHATLDGGIVVHHDPEIPGVGPIAQLSLAEARRAPIRNREAPSLLAQAPHLVGKPGLSEEGEKPPAE